MASERLHVLIACVAIPADNHISTSFKSEMYEVVCSKQSKEYTRPRDLADQLQAVKRIRKSGAVP